jgi:tripartite motif-containing protein 71
VSIAINPSGCFYVTDQQSHQLFEINENPFSIKKIGGQGWGNTEFDSPSDVTSSFLLDIFVVDKYNYRIQKYDKSLNFIQSFNETSIADLHGKFQPLACAVSSQGDLFVIDADANRVLKINRRNRIEKEFGSYSDGYGAIVDPKDITVGSNNIVSVLDKTGIKMYDVYGNFLRKIPTTGNEQWKTIQSYDESVIATSAHSIYRYSIEGDIIAKIPASAIIGFNNKEEFQDVLFTPASIYILTSTTLYHGSFNK